MAFESILACSGGLNTDDSLLTPPDGQNAFDKGDYRYARNVRIGSSYEDNIGAVENLPSTLLCEDYYIWDGAQWVLTPLGPGNYQAIGKLEAPKMGAVFYFVANVDFAYGYILKFVKSERRIYQLLYWTGFNFNIEYKIQACLIGNYLIFCDNRNPNRIVDVNDIYRLQFTLGANLSEYHLSFAKWAPLAPAAVGRSVTGGDNEYVKTGIFQFSYRYIYKGGFKSTFAPPSFFATNDVTGEGYDLILTIPGFIFDYDTPANTSFQHTSIKFYAFVEYIEIAFRESETDTWKIWKRVTVDSSISTQFTFDNTGPSSLVPEIESSQPFDSVPFKSAACEAIDNRPMFGNNLDELEAQTDFDVEDVAVRSQQLGEWNGPATGFSSLSAPEKVALNQIINIKQNTFIEGGIYKLGIIYQHYSGRTGLVQTLDKWTYRIPLTSYLSSNQDYHALEFTIPGSVTPPDWAVAYQIVRTNCLNIEFFIDGEVNDYIYLANDVNAMNDEIQTPDDIKTAINEFYNATGTGSEGLPLHVRMLNEVRKNKHVGTLTLASRIYMDISNWMLTSKIDGAATGDNPANNVFYSFLPGDRVKFQGQNLAGNVVEFDEEIVDYTGKGIIISKPTNLFTGCTPRGGGQDYEYRIKIYRPKKFQEGQQVVFYDMGEWYPITQPTTPSRDYSKRDFTFSAASAVTVTTVNGHTIYQKMPIANGDGWIVNKGFYYDYFNVLYPGVSTRTKWVQMNPDKDNAGGDWEHNTGRPYLAYKYYPVDLQKETQIRFGGKFLEDSLLLAINTFRDGNQFIYPAEYGAIRAMVNTNNAQVESVGNVLIVIGEIESFSVYVNRTTLEDLSGRTQVSISDKVLGSFNTLLGEHGTLNPESVSKKHGRVLWWDASEGCWVRYSRDGLTEVSEFKMKNWFKDISDLIIDEYGTASTPKVISVFDTYHQEWITRIDHSALPATFRGYESYKCASFAERNADKRWKSIYDYAPDLFASLDNEVYSIIGHRIHIHEEGTDFGSIYGNAVDSELELVSSTEPRKVKDWRTVAVDATDGWSMESIKGDWKSNGVDPQESRIPLTSFEAKESVYWAPIKRDLNSPNAGSAAEAVVNGNPIKSRSLRLFMKLDPAVDYLSVFNWLIVGYDHSEKNPKN